jgi:hypothetical protein
MFHSAVWNKFDMWSITNVDTTAVVKLNVCIFGDMLNIIPERQYIRTVENYGRWAYKLVSDVDGKLFSPKFCNQQRRRLQALQVYVCKRITAKRSHDLI